MLQVVQLLVDRTGTGRRGPLHRYTGIFMGFSENEFLYNSYFYVWFDRVGEAQRRCWDGVYTSSYTSSLSSSCRVGSLNLSRQEVDLYFCIGSFSVEDWE